jgi:hypothetical protein
LVWLLPLDLSGKRDPTSSYATAGIAFRVSGALKPHHHDKVETPLVSFNTIQFYLRSEVLTAVNVKITVFLDVTSYILADSRLTSTFGLSYCLYLQGRKFSLNMESAGSSETLHHIPHGGDLTAN